MSLSPLMFFSLFLLNIINLLKHILIEDSLSYTFIRSLNDLGNNSNPDLIPKWYFPLGFDHLFGILSFLLDKPIMQPFESTSPIVDMLTSPAPVASIKSIILCSP
jgi:hypothetical protein